MKPNNSTYINRMQRNISLAFPINFIRHLYFFLPIWYAFETQFANVTLLGIIYAASHAITVLLELPTGALADLIGRKKTIVIGLILEGCGYITISQATNSNWLWLGYVFAGVSGAMISGADEALSFDSLKELKKEKTYSNFSAKVGLWIRIAIIIGTFFGGLVYNFNSRLPYLIVGINVIFAGLISLLLTEPKIDTEKFSIKSYITQTKRGFSQLIKNSFIKSFSFYYLFVGGLSWYFMFFLNMAYANWVGMTTREISVYFGGIYLLSSVLNILITRREIDNKKIVYIGLPVVMALGYLPGYWAGKSIAILLIFLIQFVGMTRFSLLNLYANLEFESKYRATAMSSLNMAVSLFTAGVSAITGNFIENCGAGFVMTMMGIITLLTAVPLSVKIYDKEIKNG